MRIALILCLFSLSVFFNDANANNVNLTESCISSFTYEMVLPAHLAVEDIVSFEMVEMGAASSIYEIRTIDGEIFYEVLSVVSLEVLPYAAQFACIGVTKNPKFCSYVKMAGAMIIKIFGDRIAPEVNKFWAARISGANGYASLFTDTMDAAREGQIAFEDSRNETGYPWQPANLVTYKNWSARLGDN